MSTIPTYPSARPSLCFPHKLRLVLVLPVCLLLPVLATPASSAQTGAPPTAATQTAALNSLIDLPNAPGENPSLPGLSSSSSASTSQPAPQNILSGHLDTVVLPNEPASPLTARQKFLLGLKESVSPFEMAGWVASAAFSQATNGPPNFGTDAGAYGQRIGAAAIRDVSENIFSDALLAPLFHQDPRYYTMGPTRNPVRRGLYAITRVFITRTDSGRVAPNYSLLGGNLAGAALTNAYYPQLNHGVTQTMKTFGGSLGGSAIGFGLSEFYVDMLEFVHLKRDN